MTRLDDTGLENTRIACHRTLTTPVELKRALPVTPPAAASVAQARATVSRILSGEDPRLLVVVGPCSIHDTDAAMEYGARLAALAHEVDHALFLVMRTYFEKPRTTVGWKGLINDPHLDDSFQIEAGLRMARTLLLDLASQGLPLSTEALDPITPQYLQDLICWTAIGARTTESQTHRELASGLSSAVGFKNGTDGSLSIAVNALLSAANPHRFLGINPDGQVAVIESRGNPEAHIVLRGGSAGPNFDAAAIAECQSVLNAAGVQPRVMVDCSHANSCKDASRQPAVARNVIAQRVNGNRDIIGLMLESHLHAGSQSVIPGQPLRYGVSITDACIDWETTATLLKELAEALSERPVSGSMRVQ